MGALIGMILLTAAVLVVAVILVGCQKSGSTDLDQYQLPPTWRPPK